MSIFRECSSLHSSALYLASEEYFAKADGHYATAKILRLKAFELEREAALLLVDAPVQEVEPTRGILFWSAASLALECDKFEDAEQLATLGLTGKPSDRAIKALRDLLKKARTAKAAKG